MAAVVVHCAACGKLDVIKVHGGELVTRGRLVANWRCPHCQAATRTVLTAGAGMRVQEASTPAGLAQGRA